jgi:SAM-dependent methyltransferase
MKILHPNNDKFCSLNDLKNYYSNGYYSIISDNEKEKLNYFLNSFQDYRKKNNSTITNKNVYKDLPFSINDITWRERQKDAKIIDKLIKNKKHLEVLDVGSWNGWLCNHLSKKGHNLTGINLFTDEFDGLKSYVNYATKATLLQMHADELFRVDKKFDLIIFNRNWAFFNKKQVVLDDAKKKLTKNGQILFTGLAFFKNPLTIKHQFQIKKEEFQINYQIPLFYKKSKGYLNFNDQKFFKKNAILLNSYSIFRNYVKLFFSKKPIIYYGLLKNNKNNTLIK